jgi:hypothetical protein
MSAYSFIRRSRVAFSFSDNGLRAVDHARVVLEMTDVSPRMQGLAASQIARGYALNGNESASSRALDDGAFAGTAPRLTVGVFGAQGNCCSSEGGSRLRQRRSTRGSRQAVAFRA